MCMGSNLIALAFSAVLTDDRNLIAMAFSAVLTDDREFGVTTCGIIGAKQHM